jgi:NDP-sugar pyrophosphorylase family protein
MGGLGSRFSTQGYNEPKPFLPLLGKTMIENIIDNLLTPLTTSVTLIVREEHRERFEALFRKLDRQVGDLAEAQLKVEYLAELSMGPADSVKQAANGLNNQEPMIVANSDQIILGGISDLYQHLTENEGENALYVLEDSDPKWSFARINSDGYVEEVLEKQPISKFATAGIYGFSSVKLFMDALAEMYAADDRTNGEFYVGPIYNYLSSPTKAIHLGPNLERFFGLGTPPDYELFKNKFELGAP